MLFQLQDPRPIGTLFKIQRESVRVALLFILSTATHIWGLWPAHEWGWIHCSSRWWVETVALRWHPRNTSHSPVNQLKKYQIKTDCSWPPEKLAWGVSSPANPEDPQERCSWGSWVCSHIQCVAKIHWFQQELEDRGDQWAGIQLILNATLLQPTDLVMKDKQHSLFDEDQTFHVRCSVLETATLSETETKLDKGT